MLAVKDTSCLADYGFKQLDLQAEYDIWQYACGCGIYILVNHLDKNLNPVHDNVICIYNDTGNDNLVPLPEVIMEMIQSGDVYYAKTRSKERY